jgi:hypothetical protein
VEVDSSNYESSAETSALKPEGAANYSNQVQSFVQKKNIAQGMD